MDIGVVRFLITCEAEGIELLPGAMSPVRGNPLVTTLRVLAAGMRSRGVLGTSEQAFLMAGALCLRAALLALRIGPRPRRQRPPAARGTSTWPATTS